MKKHIHYLAICSISFLMTSCSLENEMQTEVEILTPKKYVAKDSSQKNTGNTYFKNQLIVQYNVKFLNQKEKFRKKYHVDNYQSCSCGDETIELWSFDKHSSVDIEETKQQVESDVGLEGNDFNFVIKNKKQVIDVRSETEIIKKQIVSGRKGVTIAVLDTGVQYDYKGFTIPFLYNNEGDNTCFTSSYQEISGWDFVNNDNNPYDDNGHGTIVTHIITRTLDAYKYPYQILPIKVLGQDGEGTYFNVLCGFQYAISKKRLDIINMSLGWYHKPYRLLQELISKLERERDILIITSAGNMTSDNDVIPHFPSSYMHKNILSITSMNSDMNALAKHANYGILHVDLAAPGEHIPFSYQGQIQYVSGTSFAAPHASALAAYIHAKTGITMKKTKLKMIDKAQSLNALYKIKHKAYIQN